HRMLSDPNNAGALVEINGLAKKYGRVSAIRDVSFSIRTGEILGLIGPNGAGKTTLFECLAGVQPADSGVIVFAASQPRHDVLFYIPDSIAPWPSQTVRWALDFTLGYFGGRKDLYREIVDDLRLAP